MKSNVPGIVARTDQGVEAWKALMRETYNVDVTDPETARVALAMVKDFGCCMFSGGEEGVDAGFAALQWFTIVGSALGEEITVEIETGDDGE